MEEMRPSGHEGTDDNANCGCGRNIPEGRTRPTVRKVTPECRRLGEASRRGGPVPRSQAGLVDLMYHRSRPVLRAKRRPAAQWQCVAKDQRYNAELLGLTRHLRP